MGYTTEFAGAFTITPPIEYVDEINARLAQDWGVPAVKALLPDAIHTRWCDWEVSPDGTKLRWNGSEKSYCMEVWLALLIRDVFDPAGVVLTGVVRAQGEQRGDSWEMRIEHNQLEYKKA